MWNLNTHPDGIKVKQKYDTHLGNARSSRKLRKRHHETLMNVLLWKEISASLSVSIAYYKYNIYVFNLCCKLCVRNLENGFVDIYILEDTVEYRGFQEAAPCL